MLMMPFFNSFVRPLLLCFKAPHRYAIHTNKLLTALLFLYFIETDEEHINFNFQLRFITSSVSFSSLIFKHYKLFVERNETVRPGPI